MPSFRHSFGHSILPSFHSFIHSFMNSFFLSSFLPSFIPSFIHSFHVISCHFISFHAIHFISCHFMSFHVMSFHSLHLSFVASFIPLFPVHKKIYKLSSSYGLVPFRKLPPRRVPSTRQNRHIRTSVLARSVKSSLWHVGVEFCCFTQTARASLFNNH